MPESSILTIVFRGLTVFHKHPQNSSMEIGVLTDPGHVPRISTIQNGVLSDVADLRTHPAFDDKVNVRWLIQMSGVAPNARIYTNGSIAFNRLTHPDDKDFRWISDLEGPEFYRRDLTNELDLTKLFPIVEVPYGTFYTRLKSPPLERKQGAGTPSPFGCIGGVTGCDIEVPAGAEVKLVVENTGAEIFTFKGLPNTIYEFANNPPDVVVSPGHHHEHGTIDPVPMPVPTAVGSKDHFQHYYVLFINQDVERFEFSEAVGTLAPPAPRPALCGGISLGSRVGRIGG